MSSMRLRSRLTAGLSAVSPAVMETDPLVAANAPSSSLSSVVLPAPFSPMTATRLSSGVIVSDVGRSPPEPSS